jgi:hypothetical protein
MPVRPALAALVLSLCLCGAGPAAAEIRARVTTDKDSYARGGIVGINIANTGNDPFTVFYPFFFVEQLAQDGKSWVPVENDICVCAGQITCDVPGPAVLEPGQSHPTYWYQMIVDCASRNLKVPVDKGIFRVGVELAGERFVSQEFDIR